MSQLRLNTRWGFLNYLRYYFQRSRLKYLGKSVYIEKNVSLMRFPKNIEIEEGVFLKEGCKICACNSNANIRIGINTTIGYNTYIFASKHISIGNNCLIAPFVYIIDSDHNIKKEYLINEQPNTTAAICIANDVWIGTGAKILKGVNIGNGAVIAAGALVKSDVGNYEIFGGVPAKKISERR